MSEKFWRKMFASDGIRNADGRHILRVLGFRSDGQSFFATQKMNSPYIEDNPESLRRAVAALDTFRNARVYTCNIVRSIEHD